jgi:serine/threonine protein kinase
MRALYLIPKNPPPKLNEKGKWSKELREFVKDSLVKNPAKRPSAAELMKVVVLLCIDDC